MTSGKRSSQVIYIDTKDWIELSRGYYGKDPEFQKIAQVVVDKSKSGAAIFPLSFIHLSETFRRLNSESRKRLAEYMVLVSHGWSILPAPTIIEPEIKNAVLEYMGRPPKYDLSTFVFKKGVSQLLGATGTLVAKDSKNKLPPELKRKILTNIESADTLLLLMKYGLSAPFVTNWIKNGQTEARKLEQIRKSFQSRYKDTNRLRRAILGDYLGFSIGPKMMPFLMSVHPNPQSFINNVTKDPDEIVRFFQLIPTAFCYVQLTIYRDLQTMRTIQANDMHDIMGLSIAIPYTDVVVTEKLWQTAIIQTKLDKLYRTVVLKSTKQLAPILESK
jgi:hypothetical protein